jgi:hypothetical protein
MATDYDTPRKTDEELHEESLEELKAKRAEIASAQIDVDEEDPENVELPGADLSGCFLVHHHTQLARGEGAKAVCKDCA